jgi:ribonuclease P protein component
LSPQSFPKLRRVRARGDFLGIQRRGRRFSRGCLVMVAARSKLRAGGPARLGLVVSRKIGTAVKRNTFKRWVREWFRRATALPKGLDVVIIAKPGVAELGFARIREDLEQLVLGLPLELRR